MAEHSPGPWAWTNACEINGMVYAEALRPSEGEAVLLARIGILGLSPGDAAVIASAPDLLASVDTDPKYGAIVESVPDLMEFAADYFDDMDGGKAVQHMLRERAAVIRAAIAKATQPAEATP